MKNFQLNFFFFLNFIFPQRTDKHWTHSTQTQTCVCVLLTFDLVSTSPQRKVRIVAAAAKNESNRTKIQLHWCIKFDICRRPNRIVTKHGEKKQNHSIHTCTKVGAIFCVCVHCSYICASICPTLSHTHMYICICLLPLKIIVNEHHDWVKRPHIFHITLNREYWRKKKAHLLSMFEKRQYSFWALRYHTKKKDIHKFRAN